MNIIDYAEQELRTFEEKAFCEVDSLVLSQMSYFFYDGIVSKIKIFTKAISIKDIYCAEYFSGIFNLIRIPEQNRRLFAALVASPRYRGIKLNYYVNEFDENMEKQFSAITFVLDKKNAYIAFRGTDATIVGWKEDFNMAFLDEVPAQKSAKEYVNQVAKKLRRSLMLGGHSKGGNLAVYAAAMCETKAQEKIVGVYSHDGPGFKSLTNSGQYKKIKDMIHKTVPKSAIIGMLLENEKDYTVIKSNNQGIMQHDPFSWEIDDAGFATVDKIGNTANYMNNALHNWLMQMQDDERERFVNALFQLIQSANVKTVYDFEKIKLRDLKTFSEIMSDLDADTKKFFFDALKKLVFTSSKRS